MGYVKHFGQGRRQSDLLFGNIFKVKFLFYVSVLIVVSLFGIWMPQFSPNTQQHVIQAGSSPWLLHSNVARHVQDSPLKSDGDSSHDTTPQDQAPVDSSSLDTLVTSVTATTAQEPVITDHAAPDWLTNLVHTDSQHTQMDVFIAQSGGMWTALNSLTSWSSTTGSTGTKGPLTTCSDFDPQDCITLTPGPPASTYAHHIQPVGTDITFRTVPGSERHLLDPAPVFARANHVCARDSPPTEYCSVGQVRGFLGNIDDLSNLNEMLQARTYRGEIILLMCDIAHIDMPLNSILTLRERGYDHYVLLMLSEEDCLAAAKFLPNIGCVWSSFLKDDHPPQLWHNVRRLWMIRWMLILRLLQQRANVLMLDSDNGVLHDVYKYIKSDQLGRYNLMTPFEPNLPGINCGAIYIQNASPYGPVAWMASEVAERTLRWLEDLPSILAHFPPEVANDTDFLDSKVFFEQDIYNDAACSAVYGRPLYRNTLGPNRETHPTEYTEWADMHDELCGEWGERTVRWPPQWVAVAMGNSSGPVLEMNLTLPRAGGEWPAQFGGWPYPQGGKRGKFSKLAQMWIRAGASEGIWPLPEVEDDPEGIREKAGTEILMRTPPWLFSRWPESGVTGWWDPMLRVQPAAVLAHAIVIQGNEGEGKIAPFKVYGWWHWSVTSILHGDQMFRSSTPTQPLPKVIAFVPSVNMYTQNEQVAGLLLHHLARAAVLSGRTLVFPPIHCNSQWIRVPRYWRTPGVPENFPSPIRDHRFIAYGGLSKMKCLSFMYMSLGCHTIGMPYYDFQHMLTLLPTAHTQPAQHNTILFDQMAPNATAPKFNAGKQFMWRRKGIGYPQHEKPYALHAPTLQRVLADMADQPVVWVGASIQVLHFPEEHRGKMDKWLETCDKDDLKYGDLFLDAWWNTTNPVAPTPPPVVRGAHLRQTIKKKIEE